jgi:hypothetical protein
MVSANITVESNMPRLKSEARLQLHTIILLSVLSSAIPSVAYAESTKFNGTWTLDLRSTEEKRKGMECGLATFSLKQNRNKVSGTHSFSTPNCGRMNEGGENSVKGIVIRQTAVLVVTSGRNGEIVMGTAQLHKNRLFWKTEEILRHAEPEGDSPLMLNAGVLSQKK